MLMPLVKKVETNGTFGRVSFVCDTKMFVRTGLCVRWGWTSVDPKMNEVFYNHSINYLLWHSTKSHPKTFQHFNCLKIRYRKLRKNKRTMDFYSVKQFLSLRLCVFLSSRGDVSIFIKHSLIFLFLFVKVCRVSERFWPIRSVLQFPWQLFYTGTH